MGFVRQFVPVSISLLLWVWYRVISKYHVISISSCFLILVSLVQGHLKSWSQVFYHLRLSWNLSKCYIILGFLCLSRAQSDEKSSNCLPPVYAGFLQGTKPLAYMYFLSYAGWWLVKLLIISIFPNLYFNN